MPRTIWKGSISFGLVNIPIKVATAYRNKDVRFHLLHAKDGVRIKQVRMCPKDGEEVSWDDTVRGYEVARDQYVVVKDEELENLEPKASRNIEILDFVDEAQIDPVFYDRPYYIVPEEGATKAYALLLRAMREADKVAIARVVMRQKEYLVALRPKGDALTMETMRFAEELVPAAVAMEGVKLPLEDVEKRELAMAERLIEALAADFDPTKYEDRYRQRVMELVEKKAEGEEIVLQPSAEPVRPTGDLLGTLEKSIEEARRRIQTES